MKRAGALPSWNYSLLVPDLEARDMELDGDLAIVCGHAFHDELRLGDDLSAGVTTFTSTGPAPHARDAVVREPAVTKLVAYETTETLGVHRARPFVGWRRTTPDSPGSRRPEASTRKARVQAKKDYTGYMGNGRNSWAGGG